jgi:hypothetical protein
MNKEEETWKGNGNGKCDNIKSYTIKTGVKIIQEWAQGKLVNILGSNFEVLNQNLPYLSNESRLCTDRQIFKDRT